MLLTLTTTHRPATDLGYLLHKNPARVQTFDLAFGKAHVFYPEANEDRCTAALLLDVDPIALVRGRGALLTDYVNDRPYVASSFLSVAIARVFGSALGGRSTERPTLVDEALPLSATVAALPCGNEAAVRGLFEPLGYEMTVRPPDAANADGRYRSVTLSALVALHELLTHLYVLVPVLDNRKHYWVGDDEVDKLIARGQGWLESHPERDFIVRRYLKHQRVEGAGTGVIHTRTGRAFFAAPAQDGFESALLARLRDAADRCDLWGRFKTDWFCLDCELMPWSAKAEDLVKSHYQPVAEAASLGLTDATAALEAATARGLDSFALLARFQARSAMARDYARAYTRYNWPVTSVDDLKLAPFHLLATEGAVHVDKDHGWHMGELAKLCAGNAVCVATAYRAVELSDESSCAAAVAWWEELTANGGEGMVVKPWQFVVAGEKGLVQPAVKCRGREYLRIIYGPEYTAAEHLARLKQRNLGAKRSLARREFALGLEALTRFVEREPLTRVHECVFGVLAMESEPVDPRL